MIFTAGQPNLRQRRIADREFDTHNTSGHGRAAPERLLTNMVCAELLSDNPGKLGTNVTCPTFSVCNVIRRFR